MMNKPKLSVCALFVFEEEYFWIKRKNNLKSFPGYTSLPGGKVDKNDKRSNFHDTLIEALNREIYEELKFDLSQVTPTLFMKAMSPTFNPTRFETYFFIVECEKRPQFEMCSKEIEWGKWFRPQLLLKQFAQGDHLLIIPMQKLLLRLEQGLGQIKKEVFEYVTDHSMPEIENIAGVKQVMPLSLTIPPAERTNAFIIGDLLIDPSPKDENEFNLFWNHIFSYGINKVMITHHHADHHRNLPMLLRQKEFDVLISEDSYNRITKKDSKYFDHAHSITFLTEKMQVTKWLGEEVQVYSIPGHDEGHFGLAPESLKWFIVGDLFQGIGTVVVGGDEGDMQKYFHSLEKVIDLGPQCVIPSHGIPLGGTFILEKTLEHRKFRESQIKNMYNQGLSIEQMYQRIYFNIPAKLEKYAMANIKSHLTKILKEL